MHCLPSSHWRISLTGGKYAPPETGDWMGFAPRRFLSTVRSARITTLLPLLSSPYDDSNFFISESTMYDPTIHVEQRSIQISARGPSRFLPFVPLPASSNGSQVFQALPTPCAWYWYYAYADSPCICVLRYSSGYYLAVF